MRATASDLDEPLDRINEAFRRACSTFVAVSMTSDPTAKANLKAMHQRATDDHAQACKDFTAIAHELDRVHLAYRR